MIIGSKIYSVSYDDFIEESKRFCLLSINLLYRVVPEECHNVKAFLFNLTKSVTILLNCINVDIFILDFF